LRIVLDETKCTGLGVCEAKAPDLFELMEDGTLKMLCERPPAEQRAAAEDAVASCPTEALRLVEE
jgi:ferredoxin